MKQVSLILAILFSSTFISNVYSQAIRANGEMSFIRANNDGSISPDLKKIDHKKYLTATYEAASVNGGNETAYLRYNIFKDEMEFVKEEQNYYLSKQKGTTVFFKSHNKKYIVFEKKGKLHFFVQESEGSSMLLSKELVKFVEAKEPKTSYDKRTPPVFKRKKDELYLGMNNGEAVKIPKKKKDFYALFGDKSSDIKKYIKQHKLSHKKKKNLKKIVSYYNTL